MELFQENIFVNKFEHFYRLNKCKVTDALKNNGKQFQLQI